MKQQQTRTISINLTVFAMILTSKPWVPGSNPGGRAIIEKAPSVSVGLFNFKRSREHENLLYLSQSTKATRRVEIIPDDF